MVDREPALASSALHPALIRRRWILVLLVVLAAVALHWLLFQGEERTPGVVTRRMGVCDVMWFGNRHGAVVIACPHTDLIRLWPLPVEQPWYEDLPVRPDEMVF